MQDKVQGKEEIIRDVVNQIQFGRVIDTNKRCPYINEKCIKNDCIAFSYNYEIKIIDSDEIFKIKSKEIPDTREELMKENWTLEQVILTPRLLSLDEEDWIYSRKLYGNTGRCKVLGTNPEKILRELKGVQL